MSCLDYEDQFNSWCKKKKEKKILLSYEVVQVKPDILSTNLVT